MASSSCSGCAQYAFRASTGAVPIRVPIPRTGAGPSIVTAGTLAVATGLTDAAPALVAARLTAIAAARAALGVATLAVAAGLTATAGTCAAVPATTVASLAVAAGLVFAAVDLRPSTETTATPDSCLALGCQTRACEKVGC